MNVFQLFLFMGSGDYMYLYLHHSGNRDKEISGKKRENPSGFSDMLIRKALLDYCGRRKTGIPNEILMTIVIERSESGKPFFHMTSTAQEGRPAIHFSVSHSGNWWGCLMGEEPVGFDMEVCREKVHYEKIARRFFSEEECGLILSAGRDAFFDVWVRKEAYVKYLGTGLAEGLDSFTVAAGGKLMSEVISKKSGNERTSPCFIRSCEILDGIKAAYCSGSGKPVEAVVSLELQKY